MQYYVSRTLPRGNYSGQCRPPSSLNPICGTPRRDRRIRHNDHQHLSNHQDRIDDRIPAFPPPRPKLNGLFKDKNSTVKSTDDTDDGYDECQTSDESSDIDSNNVVSFQLKDLSGFYS